ncbi:MAG: peptidase M1 [Bacteroidetes bacterium HGW-Bacteroidetes-2]|jgi:aminopeptidase N|nr:MAG: peptidase M1 [Bacteroidetes bacterium HGW-Bacteroidetes-2]
MKKIFLASIIFCAIHSYTFSQTFTRQDSLRGSITLERAWWDVTFYHLDIEVKPDSKWIGGKNTIRYSVLEPHTVMQIDLQKPLNIEKVTQDGKTLFVKSDGNAHFITLKKKQKKGASEEVVVYYSGHPREAKKAPWDGGISWKLDAAGNPFIGSSCQGLGASVWWPNKDHMYDEVDSLAISVRVPKKLTNVSNGRLKKIEDHTNNTRTFHWVVQNPINNYGVNINIGNYVHFGETYKGENGSLDMDYWVLKHNLEKAKEQFKDAPRTIEAFEHWFGPYPFYEDSYKLVEAPYLGMEHQSSVTYGNGFKNGYLGTDLSGSGWGLKFDFIIVHESGHEWFANNITYKDIADMWVHESFTAYAESLFVEYFYGKEAGNAYVVGTKHAIQNDKPIIGTYNVNQGGSGDQYYKGANMLHTLRQLIEDDEKWRKILRGLNRDFWHQTVTTQQIENYLSEKSGIDLNAFFNQYLRDTRIPMVEFKVNERILSFRYTNVVQGFDMPVKLFVNNQIHWILPKPEWNVLLVSFPIDNVHLDANFLVEDFLVK